MYRKSLSVNGSHKSVAYKPDRDCNNSFFPFEGNRSVSFSEQATSSFGSDNKKRERDYSYKGRSFVNSNWRKPQQSPNMGAIPGFVNRSPKENSSLILKRDSAVDNLIPHFCVKSIVNPQNQERNTNPSDQVGLQKESWKISEEKEKSQNHQTFFGNTSAQSIRNQTKPDLGSWRNSGNSISETPSNVPWNIRRKFTYDVELNESEMKRLAYPESLKNMLKSRYSLNEIISKLDVETKHVEIEEHEREEIAREHLEEEMKFLYENCKAIPYSLRVLGMAHSQCSMYLFFDAGSSYNGNVAHDKIVQETIRKNVFDKMNECGHCEHVRNWDVQELITFEHTDSRMRCVISVDSGMKHRNTLLIRTFLALDKRVRLLMLVVIDLVYQYHDLSKFFTSYILQIMVIMYLQHIPDPILPTLELLRKTLPSERIFIKGFDCSFPYDVSLFPRTKNTQSMEELLLGFCSYYLKFNWDEDVISILGPDLKRSMFRNPHEVPTYLEPPLSSYFQSLCWDDHASSMNCNLPIVVQDPLELGVNVAEKVNSTVLKVFKMMCSDAIDLLAKWV